MHSVAWTATRRRAAAASSRLRRPRRTFVRLWRVCAKEHFPGAEPRAMDFTRRRWPVLALAAIAGGPVTVAAAQAAAQPVPHTAKNDKSDDNSGKGNSTGNGAA